MFYGATADGTSNHLGQVHGPRARHHRMGVGQPVSGTCRRKWLCFEILFFRSHPGLSMGDFVVRTQVNAQGATVFDMLPPFQDKKPLMELLATDVVHEGPLSRQGLCVCVSVCVCACVCTCVCPCVCVRSYKMCCTGNPLRSRVCIICKTICSCNSRVCRHLMPSQEPSSSPVGQRCGVS